MVSCFTYITYISSQVAPCPSIPHSMQLLTAYDSILSYSPLRRALQDVALCSCAAIRTSRVVLQIKLPLTGRPCTCPPHSRYTGHRARPRGPHRSAGGLLIPPFTLTSSNKWPLTPTMGVDSLPCNGLKLMSRCASGCAIVILVDKSWIVIHSGDGQRQSAPHRCCR